MGTLDVTIRIMKLTRWQRFRIWLTRVRWFLGLDD